MPHILSADRIKLTPETIFTTMSRLAVEHNAINLGQGFPDFDGPQWIVEEAHRAMKSGCNQYAPMNGIVELRKAIGQYQKSFYDLNWNIDTEITITAGATEALFSTMLSIINPGDEVILFEPFYDSHQANVILAGGLPRYITLQKPDFHFDPNEFERAINQSTKLIVLNTPQNPTGKVFSSDELNFIAQIAIKNNLLVISDEVYEFLVYDNAQHIPIATLPGMKGRTITISSTGKTFGMTGWKIGYACAASVLTDAIRKVHQFVTFAVNTPGQFAMAYAINQLQTYLPEFRKEYSIKRYTMFEGLKRTSFKPHKPDGSYFIMADISLDRSMSDIDCALKLVSECGVAAIPPSVFYCNSEEGKTMLRFCFAKKDVTLQEGLRRLKML